MPLSGLHSSNNEHWVPISIRCVTSNEGVRSCINYTHKIQVIGGIQRFLAITRVNNNGSRKISSRKCLVYGSGLSRSASLVLARQHNEFNQIQRTTSFPEIAASCRRLCFAHFAPERMDTIDEGMPELPRYNSQPYRAFKQECCNFLVSTQVVSLSLFIDVHHAHASVQIKPVICDICSHTCVLNIPKTQSKPMVDQAIQMAIQSSRVYHKMQSVFAKFEEGNLKGQASRQMSGITLQKALEGKLAAKLGHFKVFQGLQVSLHCVLTHAHVSNGTIDPRTWKRKRC